MCDLLIIIGEHALIDPTEGQLTLKEYTSFDCYCYFSHFALLGAPTPSPRFSKVESSPYIKNLTENVIFRCFVSPGLSVSGLLQPTRKFLVHFQNSHASKCDGHIYLSVVVKMSVSNIRNRNVVL